MPILLKVTCNEVRLINSKDGIKLKENTLNSGKAL